MDRRYIGKVVILLLVLLSPLVSESALSVQEDHITQDKKAMITVPANWVANDYTYDSLTGSKIEMATVFDRTQPYNRKTRFVVIYSADKRGMFGLPNSVVSLLSEKTLVNYYISQQLFSSIKSSVIGAGLTERNGRSVYSVEWTYSTTENLKFVVFDEFIFHNGSVIQAHGEYATSQPEYRDLVKRVVESAHPL